MHDLPDTPRSATPTAPRALPAGQRLDLCLPKGSVLQVCHGSLLLLGPPHWLGEQVWRPRHTLRAGQVQVLDEGGWVQLCAIAGEAAAWRVQPPPPALRRLRAALAAVSASALARVQSCRANWWARSITRSIACSSSARCSAPRPSSR